MWYVHRSDYSERQVEIASCDRSMFGIFVDTGGTNLRGTETEAMLKQLEILKLTRHMPYVPLLSTGF